MNTTWIIALVVGVVMLLIASFAKIKKKDSVKTVGFLLLALGVIGMLWIPTFDPIGGASTNAVTGGVSTNTQGQQTNTPIITTNPTIAVAAQDAVSGASVGTSITYQFSGTGGFVSSPSTAVPGQQIELLVTNGTTNHNAYVAPFTVAAQSFPVSVKLYPNVSVTENILSTTGTAVLTNGGGANNQTKLGAGSTYNFPDSMTPSSSGPIVPAVCVLELSAGINASTVASTPAVAVSYNGAMLPVTQATPPWYTITAANAATSKVWYYTEPQLPAGIQANFNIQINGQPASSGSAKEVLGAGQFLKKTCYTTEDFTYNGVHYNGVADGANTIKSLASYGYTIYGQ